MKFTEQDIAKAYEELTQPILLEGEFTTELVGGMPADDEGLKNFVKYVLKLDGEEADKEVKRIRVEELGSRDVPQSDEDDIKEKKTYGVNVVRRDDEGSWIGNWMVKACMKAAAKRLSLTSQKRGSKNQPGVKGDLAEFCRVMPVGKSDKNTGRDRIHLFASNGNGNKIQTSFKEFMGSVFTPQGRRSIVHHSECVPVGTRFHCEIRLPKNSQLTTNDVVNIVALMGEIGLGSAKALERGKFKTICLEIPEEFKK